MSEVTVRSGEGNNQLTADYDYAKIFIGSNFFKPGPTITASGADVVIAAGQVIGKNTSSLFDVLKSASVDGSQYPSGIAARDYIIPDGESIEISICVSGEVAKEKVVFDGSDDFDTVVDGRILEERIQADTAGIILVETCENTIFDNAE